MSGTRAGECPSSITSPSQSVSQPMRLSNTLTSRSRSHGTNESSGSTHVGTHGITAEDPSLPASTTAPGVAWTVDWNSVKERCLTQTLHPKTWVHVTWDQWLFIGRNVMDSTGSSISAQQSGRWVGRLTNSHPTQTVASALSLSPPCDQIGQLQSSIAISHIHRIQHQCVALFHPCRHLARNELVGHGRDCATTPNGWCFAAGGS